ncbi:MAG: cyclic nucleotide-binding domain-containing protein [Clostridia bacterium]|nr:cyclic nucleotide-binding domain-containing protein [Clostridia bacterium]
MKELAFKKDDVIFRQGDKGAEMYYINSGKVGIYIEYGTPRQRLLAEIATGDYFGEMAIIDNMPRSATAAVTEDALITSIDSDTFHQFIGEHPQIAIEIMTNLSLRLRSLTVEFMEACRTISESMEETGHIKKKGLRERLKKYSDMYVQSATIIDKETGEEIYVGNGYFGESYNGMMF